MEHFRKLERMYAAAPINAYFAPTLGGDAGQAVIRIPLRPDLHHSAGASHGTVYFITAAAELFDGAGALIGRGEGRFARSRIPLDPSVRYA